MPAPYVSHQSEASAAPGDVGRDGASGSLSSSMHERGAVEEDAV
jgi:hypothetical protein